MINNNDKAKYKEFFRWLFEKDEELFEEFDIATEKTVYYTEGIKNIIETNQMQRLKKIMQLSTVILENDNAYHTRYEHSLGTYNNGLVLFTNQFQDEKWRQSHNNRNSKMEIKVSLIELLTHDIGHLTFSHTLEELIGKRGTHEEITNRIVDEKLEKEIRKIDPELPEIIKKHRNNSINISTIEDGNVDLDRMDYLLHDAIYLDEDEDIDEVMSKILSGVKLQPVNGLNDIPVFKESVLKEVQKFLEFRTQQYKKYYHSNRGIANDILCVNFCKLAYTKKDQIPEKFYNFLSECVNDKKNINLDTHTGWNDINTINAFLDIIENSTDDNLTEIAIQCTPSLKGMINLVYKMIDFTEEVDGKNPNLNVLLPDEEERRLYKRIKHYVKDTNLTEKEKKIKENLMIDSKKRVKSKVFSFETEGEFEEFKQKMENLEISPDILSQMMWNRKIKKYSFKSPSYVETSDGTLIDLINHPNFKMNIDDEYVRGAFFNRALLLELGMSQEKVDKVENVLSKYNDVKNTKSKKYIRSKVSENEDLYYTKELYEK